jgi:hypothetical protein
MPRGPLKPDAWYDKQGVLPPNHITHHGSDRVQSDNHLCSWIHKSGPWLHCDEGKGYGHGIPFDHINYKLVGTSEEGAPLLTPITIANQDEVDNEARMRDHNN